MCSFLPLSTLPVLRGCVRKREKKRRSTGDEKLKQFVRVSEGKCEYMHVYILVYIYSCVYAYASHTAAHITHAAIHV